jgi:trehalose 6-phosphate synthase
MIGPARPAGYDLMVATHRLPIEYRVGSLSEMRWRDPTGGAFAGLRDAVAARGGAFIGGAGPDWPTEAAPFAGLWMHPVPLADSEIEDFHLGHCGTTLDPLYYDSGEPPMFSPQWSEAYEAVNRRFAFGIARAAAPDGLVWVHDYHLQLVPGLLRRLRPDLRIGFHLHSPFPPVERFLRLPARLDLVQGLLGADLIGFQHPRPARNFVDLVAHLLGTPSGADHIEFGDRRIGVGTFPSSADTNEVRRLAGEPAVLERAAAIRAGLKEPSTVLLSVGSCHQADGVERRLDAYADLLAEGRLDPDQTVLIHVAASGGYDDAPQQQRRRDRIDRRVAQINGVHSRVGHPVIHYLNRDLDRRELVALYRAADAMLATPLHAGTTPTAKEFIAARLDDTGSLVLSEFSGAAGDLPEAIIVNPHDLDAVKAGVLTAVAQARRGTPAMRTMRDRVYRDDAAAWSDRFLSALVPDDLGAPVSHRTDAGLVPVSGGPARPG